MGKGKYAWGYEAHLAVLAANDPATDPGFPLLVLGMSLDKNRPSPMRASSAGG